MALLTPSLFLSPSVKMRSKFFNLMHNCVNLVFHPTWERLYLLNFTSDWSTSISEMCRDIYGFPFLGVMVF